MSNMYSIGQMNQLGDALELAGFTPENVTDLRNYSHWSDIKSVICGHAEIVFKKHLIDCDAAPFIPEGWTLLEGHHSKGGQLQWDPKKVSLYLSKVQKKGKTIQGHDFRKELKGQPVLNACVLDYLLAHQELIPDEWKGKLVFFWGTIYRSSDGYLNVRCLNWDGSQWYWDFSWLDDDFGGSNPAAVSASN